MDRSDYDRRYRLNSREKYLAGKRAYYLRNKEKIAKAFKEWRRLNPRVPSKPKFVHQSQMEKLLRRLEWSVRPDGQLPRGLGDRKAYVKAYRKQKPWLRRMEKAKRRAAELRATPKWANAAKIEVVYRLARLSGQTVDHIVPLASRLVCGLHCEANLAVVPALENSRKSNRHWPDMPE